MDIDVDANMDAILANLKWMYTLLGISCVISVCTKNVREN